MQNYEAILKARQFDGLSLPSRGEEGHDLYGERFQAALEQINRPDYQAGMVPWLREVNPQLYRQLTDHLPDEINCLWTAHAPLKQFEAALGELLETHRRACALYRAVQNKSSDAV